MKHFVQMILKTSFAIHPIVTPLQTAVPHLTKFLTKSHLVIYKRKKKSKSFNEKEGNEKEGQNTVIKENGETIKERTGNLDIHKHSYCHQPNNTILSK